MDLQKIKTLNIVFQDEEADIFIQIIKKLQISVHQSGFKKPFAIEERDLIEDIAEYLELESPEEAKIYSEKEQVKETY